MRFLQLAALVAASISPFAQAADANAWKSRNIYFALTDRVARSADDSGGNSCGNLGNYCGGTFKGLESKLDYIKGMGFDAIWITPVVASMYHESLCDIDTNMFDQTLLADTTDTGPMTCILSTLTMEQRMT